APFDGGDYSRAVYRLDRSDAVRLVERMIHNAAPTANMTDAALTEIEDLVEAVNGHARTLTLLAPSLRGIGVVATRERLVELMADMDRRFPGSREQSPFASVELSLRRLSSVNWERARVLGVFHGRVDLDVLRTMMGWEKTDVESLKDE